MNDASNLTAGFLTLARYDPSGQVSADYERTLYCGPEDRGVDDYDPADRQALEAAGWFFNKQIERWGYYL